MSTTAGEAPVAARAAGSSFYAAMRIMPRHQRQAMFEIYAFCRAVDDIADGDGPKDQRAAELQRWRDDIYALYRGEPRPSLQALAAAVREFDLQRDDFLAIIDGMAMDVDSTIRAPDLATLDLYCDRVASAAGRLSVRVFGMPEEPGLALAHHLGRALQLTNILRDVDEDAGLGRLYLPLEALQEAGIDTTDPMQVMASPALGVACAPVVARARGHFAASEAIMAAAPRRMVRTPRIMAAAYSAILMRTVARGWQPPRARVSLPRHEKLWILLRYAIV